MIPDAIQSLRDLRAAIEDLAPGEYDPFNLAFQGGQRTLLRALLDATLDLDGRLTAIEYRVSRLEALSRLETLP